MNGADNRKTFAGKLLAEGFGTSIQHIALASDDIFATARALTALGFQALPISRNYYDDLGARFGLEPEFPMRSGQRAFFMIATRTANTSRSTVAPSARASFSRSSSGAAPRADRAP